MSDIGDSSDDIDEEQSSEDDIAELDVDLEREPNQGLNQDFRLETGRNSLVLPPHELQRALDEGFAHHLTPGSLRTTPPQTPQQESSPPPSIQLSNLSIINPGPPPLSQYLTQDTKTSS